MPQTYNMHQFKFSQQQAKHLSLDEFEHYAELGLIMGVDPHVLDMVARTGEGVRSLQEELQDAEKKIENFPANCPKCDATIPC